MTASPNERDGLCEGSPLRSQPTPTGSVVPVPGPPGDQPPPPDAPPGYFDGGGYQTTGTYHHRRGSPSLAKIIIGGVVIFLVLMNAIRLSKLERARLEKQREELEDKRKMLENERQMWKDERLALKEERERWKKARKDHGPQGAFWESVLPAEACLSYGKREYWGVLRNIPEGWTEINACMNMPVEIKGVSIRRPHRCHYVEGSPHIHGFWMVDWDQLDCKPWHQDFNDKGCTNQGSGIHRIEARVVGINNKGNQDWRLLCDSTPMTWNYTTYYTPTRCEERWPGRKIAMWDIPDYSC